MAPSFDCAQDERDSAHSLQETLQRSLTLKVTVKLFASYKEKAGKSEIALELPEGATVRQATQEVLRLYPRITQDASRLMVAVNEEYQGHDFVLSDRDEVALIPPVSGGMLGIGENENPREPDPQSLIPIRWRYD